MSTLPVPHLSDDASDSVQLIIHVGPHKTATTSIQSLLHTYSDVLLENGIFYPPSPHISGAHHHIPCAIKGDDPFRLGILDPLPPLESEMTSWLIQARSKEAHSVLISAEDLCTLSQEDWGSFSNFLKAAEESTQIHISKIQILFTSRDFESRLQSVYLESLKHGCAVRREELNPSLETEISTYDSVVLSLSSLLQYPVETVIIDYKVEGEKQNPLLKRWFSQLLGAPGLSKIPNNAFVTKRNTAISEQTAEQLLKFNKLNSPSKENRRPFHNLNVSKSEKQLAHSRLNMFLALSIERDRLVARLETTFFQKIMRRISRYIRG